MIVLYTASIFFSACLIFGIQPMFSRMVMPLLGGSPSVWITSMVFYQAVLLLGYIYAHKLPQFIKDKKQYIFHIIFVLIPFFFLPFKIPNWWDPLAQINPIPNLLLLLLIVVGLPFFILSTNSSITQNWFSKTNHKHAKDPYFLYAASNVGSMIGLISYPILIEPYTSLSLQTNLWFGIYGVFTLLVIACSIIGFKNHITESSENISTNMEKNNAKSNMTENVNLKTKLIWLLLSAIPSGLMIGITSYFSANTDVNMVPFFWIIPLAVYLFSFILAFSNKNMVPGFFMNSPIFAIFTVFFLIYVDVYYSFNPITQLIIYILGLLYVAIVCHKKLANIRPNVKYLTNFYIWMSLGGIIGGIFCSIISPMFFNNTYEYWLIQLLFIFVYLIYIHDGLNSKLNIILDIAFSIIVIGTVIYLHEFAIDNWTIFLSVLLILYSLTKFYSKFVSSKIGGIFWYKIVLYILALNVTYLTIDNTIHNECDLIKRSFFGVIKVKIEGDLVTFYHGNTTHGSQLRNSKLKFEPTTYYHRKGPLGEFFRANDQKSNKWNVGVIGLGIGGILAYSKPEQNWTYIEIDPEVEKVASNTEYFSYVNKFNPKILIGDGRVIMEKEQNHTYDLIILDAYSSDSIPIHLVTSEAIKLYRSKLKEEGFILFHTSNRYFNLEPIVSNIVNEIGLKCYMKSYDLEDDETDDTITSSTWIVATKNESNLGELVGNWKKLEKDNNYPVWTDDKSSILKIVKWN